MYESVGSDIDIGEAIRTAGVRLAALASHAAPAVPPSGAAINDALNLLSDIRKDVLASKFGALQCDELEGLLRSMGGAAPQGAVQEQAKAPSPLTNEQVFAVSAPIFSGGNRHPRAELELARAIEAAHGITIAAKKEGV